MAVDLSGPAAEADADADAAAASITVPVCREQLQLGVRTVDTGRGVRIHKTVSEHSHPIDQALLHDAVEVKRVAVDRIVALSDAPQSRHEGDTLIVPILEEVLVVEKRLRIKEEIHITRTQHSQHYTDTVVLRAEDVTVERFDDGPNLK